MLNDNGKSPSLLNVSGVTSLTKTETPQAVMNDPLLFNELSNEGKELEEAGVWSSKINRFFFTSPPFPLIVNELRSRLAFLVERNLNRAQFMAINL